MFSTQKCHLRNGAEVRAILEASPLRETSLATDRGARNTALHLAAESGPRDDLGNLWDFSHEKTRISSINNWNIMVSWGLASGI